MTASTVALSVLTLAAGLFFCRALTLSLVVLVAVLASLIAAPVRSGAASRHAVADASTGCLYVVQAGASSPVVDLLTGVHKGCRP